MSDLETQAIRKVSRRLIPFLIVCYFVAYLDRVNVGFAALTMNKELGLTAAMYGFGAGVFFLAYFLFEVPSNLFLERFGARKWIARIMFTWGIISGVMAFIPQIGRYTGLGTEHTFYALRVLLGAAEAGFFPGMIFYFTLWFPPAYRARVIGYFMAAIPLSTIIGAPISGMLLGMDGIAGLRGWQWLFIIEAAPAIVLSVVTYFYLTDRPAEAKWLTADERNALAGALAAEHRERKHVPHSKVMQALVNPRVLGLSAVYFGLVISSYGVTFWLPQIVKSFGLTNTMTGFVTAIPSTVGVIGMIWYTRRSDRLQERRGHSAVALYLAAGGLAVATLFDHPVLKMVALSIAVFGQAAFKPVFWTLPSTFLTGAGAAAGIAAINSIGNLGGFAGPYVMGWAKDATGGYNGGLLLLAAFPFLAAFIVLVIGREARMRQERAPAPVPTR